MRTNCLLFEVRTKYLCVMQIRFSLQKCYDYVFTPECKHVIMQMCNVFVFCVCIYVCILAVLYRCESWFSRIGC
jgi:hypothetical protein